ncbi:MAG: hypothetical protein KDB50_15555 [Mycobacterium sp.]|nr:hypothetical protein [Mycobacterium sp.]
MGDSPCVVGYQRVAAAVAVLGEWATGPSGGRLAEVLAGDEVVLARMRAAVAEMRTAPLPAGLAELVDLAELAEVDPDDGTGPDLLDAARRWYRHARTVAPGLQRSCATDIARGLLRLWDSRRLPPASGVLARRMHLRRSRITLASLVRTRSAALRCELRDDIARLTLRRAPDFAEHVSRRVAAVTGELAEAVEWEIPGTGGVRPVGVDPPPHCGAEGWLGALFGAAFGLGLAVTLGRVLAGIAPGWTTAAVAVSGATGLALACWVTATRRLLARRAALDRWVAEVVTGLRAQLDEHIAMRALTAEVRLSAPAVRDLPGFDDEPPDRSGIGTASGRHQGDF